MEVLKLGDNLVVQSMAFTGPGDYLICQVMSQSSAPPAAPSASVVAVRWKDVAPTG
jgi:hypothetical protein